jgi:hypothetical protein
MTDRPGRQHRDRRLSDPDGQHEDNTPTFRDEAGWIKDIGPEDEDPEVIMDNLEEFGFDPLFEDDALSLETAEGYPGWAKNNAYADVVEVGDRIDQRTPYDADANDSLRPVEDEAIEDIDGDVES